SKGLASLGAITSGSAPYSLCRSCSLPSPRSRCGSDSQGFIYASKYVYAAPVGCSGGVRPGAVRTITRSVLDSISDQLEPKDAIWVGRARVYLVNETGRRRARQQS